MKPAEPLHPWQEIVGLILEDLLLSFNVSANTMLELLASLRSRCESEALANELLAPLQAAASSIEIQSRCLQDWVSPSAREEEGTDLNQIVKQVLSLLQAISTKRLTFIQEFEPELPPIPHDRRSVAQIVSLLCLRAGQDMPGGGSVRLRTGFLNSVQAQSLELPDTLQGYVSLALKDEAPGFPSELRKEIESALRELDYPLPPATENLIYLVSLRRLVKKCGGILRLDSQVGRGNTFTVYFPAFSVDPICASFELMTKPFSPLILLIEDEPLIQSLGRQMLESGGFRVKIADQGRRALHLLRQNLDRINLVILDTLLPDIDSLEMLKQVRHLNPTLRILLTSGHASAGSFQEWITQPGIDFIQKPFRAKELLAKVQTLFAEESLQV